MSNPISTQQISNECSVIDMQYNIAIGGERNNIIICKHSDNKPKIENIEFNLPKLVNIFRGRADEINQLNSLLFEQNNKMVTICGLPGFGKSELCKQFVRQSKDTDKIKNICWIQADTTENIVQSFIDLAKILKLPDVVGRALIQTVCKCFEGSHTAFVFDNAEDRQSLSEFETPNGCYCLITSHEKDWGDDIPSLELSELSPNAAVDLLHSILIHVEDKSDQIYNNLAHVLGNVPLALQIAAAYIREERKELRNQFNLEQYVEELSNSEEKFVDQPIPKCSALPYEKSIQKAINTSLEKIKKLNTVKSNLAIHILNICPYLNPYELSETTFLEFSLIQKILRKMKKPENEVRRALSVLDNYSFVNFNEDGSVKVHQLVQNTLLFFQYHHNEEINRYFGTCLHYAFNPEIRENPHFYGIIKYTERNFDLFVKFYSENKSNIFTAKFNYKVHNWQNLLHHINNSMSLSVNKIFDYRTSFLGVLVSMGFQKCLTHILENLGSHASKKINKYLLLHEAVFYNQPDLLKLLLSYGADINRRNLRNLTSLHVAALELNFDCIKILLENNADVNAGISVFFSVIFGSGSLANIEKEDNLIFDILNILVKSGANPHAVSNLNETILHVAGMLEKLNLKVIEFLIDVLQIDINAQNFREETVLHKFIVNTCSYTEKEIIPGIKEMRVRIVESLIKRGARIDIRNHKGMSPVDLVIMYKADEVLAVMKSYKKM